MTNYEVYLVFYIQDEKEKIVSVIRVMYGGRDVDTQFKQFTN